MLAPFLITFREVLEASLIVATIVGILYKLQAKQLIKTVWLAVFAAVASSVGLLTAGSLLGLKVSLIFEAHEALFEGVVMIISALFITWAVFFLHKTFAHYKLELLRQVKTTLQQKQQWSIFVLVFTAVFREGLEIVLFLSTIFFSSQRVYIGTGFVLGTIAALTIATLLFTSTVKLPIYQTFRFTSILLIFFAAGLLAHGFHELTEAGVVPNITELPTITLMFLPDKSTVLGSLVRSLFGLSRVMHSLEILLWSTYAFIMWNKVIRRKNIN